MKIVCKNCGGSFDSKLSRCPYCSTMNKKGAYRNYRGSVSDIIDQMFGLKFENFETRRKVVFMAILRGLIIVFVCVTAGGLFGAMANVNYYNDKEYDQKTLEDLMWEDENLEKIEKAYAENDFDTLRKLLNQNYHFAYNWEHYTAFTLKDKFNELNGIEKLDEYVFEDILYFIFHPDYYANINRMSKEEYQEYLNNKAILIEKMKGFGYSEEEMSEIYNSLKDDYGYIHSYDLRDRMKETDNG